MSRAVETRQIALCNQNEMLFSLWVCYDRENHAELFDLSGGAGRGWLRFAAVFVKLDAGNLPQSLSRNKRLGADGPADVLPVRLCVRSMRGGTDNMMSIVWAGAVIVFGIVEAVTAGLVSIWFVVGALAAMVASIGGLGILAQLLVFIGASALALVATRPLVQKFTALKAVPTNADRVLDQTGKVTETIDNDNSSGAVYVDGKTWTARSADGCVIPVGSQVQIEHMEGVKLFVKKYEEKVEVTK